MGRRALLCGVHELPSLRLKTQRDRLVVVVADALVTVVTATIVGA